MQDAEVVIDAAGELLAAAPSLEAASSGELLARRARLVDLATRGVAAELSVAAVAASSFRRLELMLEPHLGPAEATAAAEAVTSGHGLVVERHPLSSAGIFAGPTWVELGLAPPRPRVVTAGDSTGLEALEALEARLAACRSWSRSELIRWVRRAALRRLVYDTVHQLGRREAAKAAVLAVGGLVRAVNREAGRRLVEQGALDSQDDVDLLSDGELRLAMAGRPRSRGELARRARWLERYAAEGPLPARFTGRPPRAEIELPPGDRMEGWAASPGRVSGVAQVVASPLDGIEPGRVLVAEATDASWSPLFVDAVGIVLERGGPLSHAAILARELGVPAVLNVAGATTWLDGAEVVVDGDAGVVVRSGER
jgi:pyruvate,water dikinase